VPLLRRSPVAPPEDYYAILAPLAGDLDIWECDYLHVLSGDNPVARWTQSTALRPLLDALTEPLRGQFLVAYAHRIRAAYPPRVDGRTLLPFRRLFAVARIR
jgi:trans-aconitate 2-methyltransferase